MISCNFLVWVGLCVSLMINKPANEELLWLRLPDFPESLGVAGAYAGVSNGAVIMAGGANFDKPLWKSGQKRVLDQIWVMQQQAASAVRWEQHGLLPTHVANGAAVTTPYGVVCLGGTDGKRELDLALILQWDNKEQRVITTELPRLPTACAYLSAASCGTKIVVAGGKNESNPLGMDHFWVLDLADAEDARWQSIGKLPSARFGAVVVMNDDEAGTHVWLCSGKRGNDYLTDVYQYALADTAPVWQRKADMPRAALVASVAWDAGTLLVFGGSDGKNIDKRLAMGDDYHLTDEILGYDIAGDGWKSVGRLPLGVVATALLPWRDRWLLIGGELGNAMRSRAVYLSE